MTDQLSQHNAESGSPFDELLDRASAPEPGAAAEFVAIRATNLGEAIAEAPADRIVIHRGRAVARSTTTQEILHPQGALHA